jgi:hypothetical protein
MSAKKRQKWVLTLCATIALAHDAKAVELDMKHLREISHLGVAVFYPTYVPSRFSSSTIHVSSEAAEGKEHFDYSLRFCDKSQVCFSVQSAWCGIGDGPDGDRTIYGTSEIFGRFSIYVFNPWSEGNGSGERYYLSQWLDAKSANKPVREVGCPRGPQRHYLLLGNGITDKEAIAIVSSLRSLE